MYAGVPTKAPYWVSGLERVGREALVQEVDLLGLAGQARDGSGGAREAEVEDVHAAVAAEQDVAGLEVAVDDADGVRGDEAATGGEEGSRAPLATAAGDPRASARG
jgi:hypothetical protein